MMRPLAALLSLTLASSCADVQKKHLTISPYKVPCVGASAQSCMRVDEGDGPASFYNGVQGFDFAWGREVKLEVSVEPVAQPPADGSSLHYKRVKVLDERDVTPGDTFTLTLGRDFVEGVTDAGGTLLFEKPFTCAEAATCQALIQALDTAPAAGAPQVTFAFGDPVTGPLRLRAVNPASQPAR